MDLRDKISNRQRSRSKSGSRSRYNASEATTDRKRSISRTHHRTRSRTRSTSRSKYKKDSYKSSSHNRRSLTSSHARYERSRSISKRKHTNYSKRRSRSRSRISRSKSRSKCRSPVSRDRNSLTRDEIHKYDRRIPASQRSRSGSRSPRSRTRRSMSKVKSSSSTNKMNQRPYYGNKRSTSKRRRSRSEYRDNLYSEKETTQSRMSMSSRRSRSSSRNRRSEFEERRSTSGHSRSKSRGRESGHGESHNNDKTSLVQRRGSRSRSRSRNRNGNKTESKRSRSRSRSRRESNLRASYTYDKTSRSRSRSRIRDRNRSRSRSSMIRDRGLIKVKSFSRDRNSASRSKSRSKSRKTTSFAKTDYLLHNTSLPNSQVNLNSSPSPSPPRYNILDKQSVSKTVGNNSWDTLDSFGQEPPTKDIDNGNSDMNLTLREKYMQNRQIENRNEQENIRSGENYGQRRLYHSTENKDNPNGIVETLDVDSDSEIPDENRIVLTNLNIDVTEVEIQKTISKQNISMRKPSKITIRRFAGKCDATLFFESDKYASDFRSKLNNRHLCSSLRNASVSESDKIALNQREPAFEAEEDDRAAVRKYNSYSETCFSVPSSPLGGVSPPRLSESESNIQIVEEIQHIGNFDTKHPLAVKPQMAKKIIPIFVDIFTENGRTISKIKVNLVTHQKCQQFYGQEPTILVSAFLNYMKKYYQEKRNLEMIFITPCVATFDLFFTTLQQNPVNKEVFDFYFSQWTDIQSIVRSRQEPGGQSKNLTAAGYNHARIGQLWQHVKYPEIVTSTDSVQTMKFIMDEVMSRNLHGSTKFHLEQLLPFTSPCNLPSNRYMTVVIHVGILEVDIQHQGRVLPVLGTLGFRNSHKGSWFVPVEPIRKEGSIVVESAVKLGFVQSDCTWMWGQDTSATCLVELEALECFISALREEKEISGSEGVILVTPRQDISMAILISALVKHDLLESFLSVVDGLGNIEQLASTRNIEFKSSGLKPYEKYFLSRFDQHIDLSKPPTVPKVMYQILESLLYSTPSYENFFSLYAHPVVSPYTNNFLYHSQLLELREDYHRVTVLSRTSIKPASLELVSVLIKTAPKTEIGREFFVLGYGHIKFGWNKAKLAPNLHLVLTIQNTGKQMLVLEPGDSIGLAHKQDSFPYPSSKFMHEVGEQQVNTAAVYRPSNFSYSQLKDPVRQNPQLNMYCEQPKVSQYEESVIQERISETLPFGDMIRKYRNQLPQRETNNSHDQVNIVRHIEQQTKPNLDKRSPFRDPRLNRKLAKAQQTINISCVQNENLIKRVDNNGDISEVPAKAIPQRNQMQTPLVDPRLTKRQKIPPPVININLSKEKICKKTLEQVDKEVKAIAVTIDLDLGEKEKNEQTITVEPKSKQNIKESPIESSKQENSNVSKHYVDKTSIKKHAAEKIRKLENKMTTFQETTATEKKMQSGTCFDFLKESTPLKKSTKYVSKREELIRNHHKHFKIGKKKEADGSFKLERIKEEYILKKEQSGFVEKEKSLNLTAIEINKKKSKKKQSKNSKEYLSKQSMYKNRSDYKNTEKKNLECKKHGLKSSEKREASPMKIKDQKKKSLLIPENKKGPVEEINCTSTETRKNIKSCKKKSVKELNICNLCGEKFSVIGTFRKHSRTKHIFKCEFCELFFNRETRLDDHMNNIHDYVGHIEPTKCGLCGDVFRRSSLLDRHVSSPHTFPCFECDMKFQSEKSLNKHHCHKPQLSKSEKESPESSSKTIVTIDKEQEQSNIVYDMPKEQKLKTFRCNRETMAKMAILENVANLIIINLSEYEKVDIITETKVKNKDLWKDIPKLDSSDKEQKDITNVPKDAQGTEGETADEKLSFKEQLLSEEYTCKVCMINFEGEKDLFLHNTRIHHESWSYVNKEKNLTWEKIENMKEEPKGPFVCQLCTEVHKLWGPLLKHLWIPHLFKCEYCEFSFNRNTKLEDHVNKDHDLVGLIDSTQCGMCGETFGRSSTLARHISSPHNFPCNHCEKCFQSKSVLNKHRQNCSKYQIFNIIENCLDNILY